MKREFLDCNDYLTVSEAADRLRVTPKTIYNWIAKGTLQAHRLGTRVIRVHIDDLDAMIKPY